MQSAWERWECFWVGGVRRGAVVRSFDGRLLVTRLAFEDGVGDSFTSETILRLSSDGGTWSGFRYRQEPGGVSSGVWREAAGLGIDTLPATGEYLLLDRLCQSERRTASFRRVDEAVPELPPAPAEVRRRPVAEKVDLPQGRSLVAERFDVIAGGVRAGVYWAHEGRLVRSAWGGALTFACEDASEALAGLNGGAEAFLREGFGPERDGVPVSAVRVEPPAVDAF